MIDFLMNIVMIFLTLFVIIMFACACIMGIGVIDWFFDLDIKGWLTKNLGERKIFKKVRQKLEDIENNLNDVEEPPIMPSDMKYYKKVFTGFADEKAKEFYEQLLSQPDIYKNVGCYVDHLNSKIIVYWDEAE